MLGKLIEKVIGEILQFKFISNNFIYPNQLGGLKQQSAINVGIFLTHFIHLGWVKNLQTSILAFDIAQFFQSLNHHHLPIILDKAGFDSKISSFFSDYLVGRKTQYLWNNFTSPFFNVNIGVEQGLDLSPVLLTLYLTSIFYIFEKNLWKYLILISFVVTMLFCLFLNSLDLLLNMEKLKFFISLDHIVSLIYFY